MNEPTGSYLSKPGKKSLQDFALLGGRLRERKLIQRNLRKNPGFMGVITEKGQLLVLNQGFLGRLAIPIPSPWLGLTPGRGLQCCHSDQNPFCFEPSPSCRSCRVIQSIHRSIQSKAFVTQEVAIPLDKEDSSLLRRFIMTILPIKDPSGYCFLLYFEPSSTP
jgi:hypothetical protein